MIWSPAWTCTIQERFTSDPTTSAAGYGDYSDAYPSVVTAHWYNFVSPSDIRGGGSGMYAVQGQIGSEVASSPYGATWGERMARQFTADPTWLEANQPADNWVTKRARLPAAMRGLAYEWEGGYVSSGPGLVYGVDYTEKPGYEDDSHNVDAYVDYEPGPNAPIKWTWKTANPPQFCLEEAGTYFGDDADWQLSLILDDTIYAPAYGSSVTLGGWPGAGTVIASGDRFTTTHVDLSAPDDSAVPLSAMTFMVKLEMTDPPAYDGRGFIDTAHFRLFVPRLAYQMPRYRYWIPADGPTAIPMRQKQRNDGLARSTVRARGASSVQGSTRQCGYF